MRITLGPLAKSGLETRVGPNLPVALNAALVYYVGKLSSGRGPAKFPKFLTLQGEGSGEPGSQGDGGTAAVRPEIEVVVDERIEAALFRDAKNQGVSPADLAGHAVLVYLAELDLIGDPEMALLQPVHAFAGPPRDADRTVE